MSITLLIAFVFQIKKLQYKFTFKLTLLYCTYFKVLQTFENVIQANIKIDQRLVIDTH